MRTAGTVAKVVDQQVNGGEEGNLQIAAYIDRATFGTIARTGNVSQKANGLSAIG